MFTSGCILLSHIQKCDLSICLLSFKNLCPITSAAPRVNTGMPYNGSRSSLRSHSPHCFLLPSSSPVSPLLGLLTTFYLLESILKAMVTFTSLLLSLLPSLALAQIYGPPPGPGSGSSPTTSAASTSVTAPPDTTGNMGVSIHIYFL